MFQENTVGGALENFHKGLFDNILIIIRKYIDNILIKLADILAFDITWVISQQASHRDFMPSAFLVLELPYW